MQEEDYKLVVRIKLTNTKGQTMWHCVASFARQRLPTIVRIGLGGIPLPGEAESTLLSAQQVCFRFCQGSHCMLVIVTCLTKDINTVQYTWALPTYLLPETSRVGSVNPRTRVNSHLQKLHNGQTCMIKNANPAWNTK